MDKTETLGERLLFAFKEVDGTEDKEKIAKILGYESKGAVYKIIKEQMELKYSALINFRNYTKRTIDWLLTGAEVEDKAAKVNFPPHIWTALEQAAEENENTLDEELNQIVFAQLAMRGLVSYKIVAQDDMDEVAKPLLDSMEGDVEIMGRPQRSKLELPIEEETPPRRKRAK